MLTNEVSLVKFSDFPTLATWESRSNIHCELIFANIHAASIFQQKATKHTILKILYWKIYSKWKIDAVELNLIGDPNFLIDQFQ